MAEAALNPLESTVARLFNSRLRAVLAPPDLTPLQITAVYGLLGFGALYFSDVYLPLAIEDPELLAQLQALKGSAEIVLTAGLIFLLTTRSRQAIQQQNERLDNLHAERNVLHRVFRHNLRQDINIILGYTDLIRNRLDDETLLANCEAVLERVARIEDYQTKIVQIERVLEPPTALRRQELSALVRELPVIRELQAADNVSLTLDLPEESHVFAVPSIEVGIHEVVENAFQHNDAAQPQITVSIEEHSDELIHLIVTDNGPGIPEYESEAIEEMREADLVHSSGLGLWLAKLTCTVSGGDLKLPTGQSDGNRVVLELPMAYERTIQRRVPGLPG